MQREGVRGCLFLILLGLVNYIVKALLLLQVNKGALPELVFDGVVLPSTGICVTAMQTKILTHDITLECCCDAF